MSLSCFNTSESLSIFFSNISGVLLCKAAIGNSFDAVLSVVGSGMEDVAPSIFFEGEMSSLSSVQLSVSLSPISSTGSWSNFGVTISALSSGKCSCKCSTILNLELRSLLTVNLLSTDIESWPMLLVFLVSDETQS